MPLRVIIVGGGIAGLAAATALAMKGHKITVYERAKSTTDVGFAFRITPNSDRCLKHLGIDTIEGGAVAAIATRMLDKNGNILFERRENDNEGQPSKGTSVFAFRPQVTQQLQDAAVKHGVTIKTGIKVKNVNTEQTQITLDDSSDTTISADLIIGCDGLNSVIRPLVVDTKQHYPRATSHHNCLRFMVPADEVHSNPLLSPLINETCNLASWKAGDKRILLYPVDFGRQYNLVCTHPEDLSDNAMAQQQQESQQHTKDTGTDTKTNDTTYDNHITLSQSLDIYSDCDATHVHPLFKLASPNGFRVWKLQDLDELPRWSTHHTVLIGDAAHAVLPFGFSGASMAIEDAIVLAEVLNENVTRGDELGELLKEFERVRKPRVAEVRSMSRRIGAGEERKEVLGGYMEFLGGYDAVEVGRKARREIERGS